MSHTITHLLHALNRPTPMKRQRASTHHLAPRHLSQRQAARTDNVRTDACLSMGKIDRLTEQSCDACEAGQRRAQPRSSPSQLADQASQRARTRMSPRRKRTRGHSKPASSCRLRLFGCAVAEFAVAVFRC